MELKISLKEEQKEFIRQVENDFSIVGSEKAIQFLVNEILKKYDEEKIFGEIRCVGECFTNEEMIDVEFDDLTITKMKDIFKKYDFEDYDTEEEEFGKVIRCIVNFADQECEMEELNV